MTQILLFVVVAAVFYWVYRTTSLSQSHAYTKKQFRSFILNKEQLAQSELGLFVSLVAKVAKADGRVDELEAELIGNMFADISSLFPDPEGTKALLKEIFNAEKQITNNVESVAASLSVILQNDPYKRRKMLEFLVNLAYIDGTLSQSEESMLHLIASYLHVGSDELNSLLSQFGSLHRHSVKESSLTQAYELLEIDPEASDEALKKAYRSKVREHHPDIIKAQGASEEYIKSSTEKVQEINAAYEMIKKSRGIG